MRRGTYRWVSDYLDRESLAALIEALKEFQGGVLVITHNRDFSESLCKELVFLRYMQPVASDRLFQSLGDARRPP